MQHKRVIQELARYSKDRSLTRSFFTLGFTSIQIFKLLVIKSRMLLPISAVTNFKMASPFRIYTKDNAIERRITAFIFLHPKQTGRARMVITQNPLGVRTLATILTYGTARAQKSIAFQTWLY